MSKEYVVTAAWDNTKWIVEKTNHNNPRIVGLLPPGEHPDWLQLENIDDGNGNMVPTLTVDQVTKDAVLEQRLQDQLQADADQAVIDDAKKVKVDKVKAIKDNQLNGLLEIKAAILDLKELLLEGNE